jgi:UDP-GlcNAc:undecaprenyl-phosphate GlcNAc-1-phosphate transferase
MHWITQYWPRTYITVCITAFVIAAVMMPVAIAILRRLRVLDPVTGSKIHTRPVPRGAGIVMFGAFAVAVILPGYRSSGFNGILIGAFLCMAVGALDDVLGGRIPGIWKFGTLIAATLILEQFGVRLNFFKSPILDELFTILWIVGVTSAFNGIDNMDGLAGGIAVIVSAVYVFIAMQMWFVARTETSLSWFGMLAAGIIGSSLGFLLYNFKSAKIFMGDSGSFFLGYTLAALGVMGEWSENRIVSCTVPVLVLGVPIFDFSYVIISRIIRGETRSLSSIINHCALDHLSHRLTWMGFTQRQAVLFIYLLCAVLGFSGMLGRSSATLLGSAIGIIQGLAILAVVMILMAIATHTRSDGKKPNLRLLHTAKGDKEAPVVHVKENVV